MRGLTKFSGYSYRTAARIYLQIDVLRFRGAALVANSTRLLPLFSNDLLALRCRLRLLTSVEVLLLIWGIFFIATRDTTPEQRARNFVKPIQRGKSLMGVKRSSPPPAVASDAAGGSEEQPHWDITNGGPLEATGSSNGGTGTVSAN